MSIVLVLLTVLCFTAATVLVKVYQMNAGASRFPAAYFNLVYGGASFLLLLCLKGFRLDYSLNMLLLAAGVGGGMLVYNALKIRAVSLGPVAIVSMSYVLGGIFVPSAFGILFLKEPLTLTKGVALLLFVLSFVPIILAQRTSMKLSVKLVVCCIGLFLLDGVILTMSKVVQFFLTSPLNAQDYIALYSFFCFMLSLINMAPSAKQVQPEELSGTFTLRNFFLICFSGLFNTGANVLNIIIQYDLPTSITFPIVQAGTLLLNTLAILLIYREKPNKPTVISLLLLCAGIVCISL